MTKLENVTLRRDNVGWHGVASAAVLDVEGDTVTIDLESWVDKDGYGPSRGGEWVEKEFPSTVVLFEGVSMDEDRTRNADVAYIGMKGRQYGDRYHAEFETPPPEAEYEACFPHKIHREEGAEPFITEVETEDYTLEEVVELLTTGVPTDATDQGGTEDRSTDENES